MTKAATKPALPYTVISERFWNESQSWHYERTIRTQAGTSLRAQICRNAYDDQSYAHGLAYDPASKKWNLLVNIPIQLCLCKKWSYVQKAQSGDFAADANTVFHELFAIIGE